MHVNEPSTPVPVQTAHSGTGHFLAMGGFAAFIAFMFPMVVCSIAGCPVDTVFWTVPLLFPAATEMLRRLVTPIRSDEAARQAADISRWDV
jgi:heme exporter protein D